MVKVVVTRSKYFDETPTVYIGSKKDSSEWGIYSAFITGREGWNVPQVVAKVSRENWMSYPPDVKKALEASLTEQLTRIKTLHRMGINDD